TLENPKYELIIEAQDMTGMDVGLTGTATATIMIDDKNDHSPKFTKKEFQATVEEGAVGVIVNLTVEDKDDPATGAWRAAYTIINGNPGQSFEIHTNLQTNEGMLSVVKPLDYEISAFHTLLIKVENEDPLVPDVSYGPSSTATVHITVLDVNEGPLFYPDPMMVTRQENISVGSVLLTANATDPDSLQHQTISFALTDFHAQREEPVMATMPSQSQASRSGSSPPVLFHQCRRDTAREGPGVPSIKSTDFFLHAPLGPTGPPGLHMTYTQGIAETQPDEASTRVGQRRAPSSQLVMSTRVRYSVYKDPAGWLNINPINGTVDTTAVLDRESPFVHNSVYTALFLAIDSEHVQIQMSHLVEKASLKFLRGNQHDETACRHSSGENWNSPCAWYRRLMGNPPATGTGTLLITLEDVNDNAPVIYPTTAEVCDDAKNLSVVILGASDKDLHPNTDPFKFEIHKQSVADKVWKISKINNTHALVSLLQNLNKANYQLPIMVTDSGKPPMTNITDLRVQVCSCKNSKVDCNMAGALRGGIMAVLLLSLLSVACKSV
ncbi:Cadherin-13, partial [Galemys pyrenaicus]